MDEKIGSKVGVESSVDVPPGHDCLVCHAAGTDPAGSGTRKLWSSAGLPRRGAAVSGGSVITLVSLFLLVCLS